jgi:hypothetical protein
MRTILTRRARPFTSTESVDVVAVAVSVACLARGRGVEFRRLGCSRSGGSRVWGDRVGSLEGLGRHLIEGKKKPRHSSRNGGARLGVIAGWLRGFARVRLCSLRR